MTDAEKLHEALEALEDMVEQYLLPYNDWEGYCHSFMSAGEYACEVLAALRPEKWCIVYGGMERVKDEE